MCRSAAPPPVAPPVHPRVVPLQCRRVLKYTYALGYFMADGAHERPLFESLQERLEMSTDRLAELTETPVDKLTMELRAEVRGAIRIKSEGSSSGQKPLMRSMALTACPAYEPRFPDRPPHPHPLPLLRS